MQDPFVCQTGSLGYGSIVGRNILYSGLTKKGILAVATLLLLSDT